MPKQKLSVIDNIAALNSASSAQDNDADHKITFQAGQQLHYQQPLDSSTAPQWQPTSNAQLTGASKQIVYNINDIVNLTCVSAPSRPAAKLSWVLNELPVLDSSKWLSQASYATSNEQLIESRLTLSFRLQPEHLATTSHTTGNSAQQQPAKQQAQATIAALYQNHAQRFQILRLKCLSRLSVDYSTQTSVLVSGGKTTLPKSSKRAGLLAAVEQSQTTTTRSRTSGGGGGGTNYQAGLPSASSLVASSKLSAKDQSRQQHFLHQAASTTFEQQQPVVSIYRWPRPTQSTGNEQRLHLSGSSSSSRRNINADLSSAYNGNSNVNNNDPWPSNVLELNEQITSASDLLSSGAATSRPNNQNMRQFKNHAQWSARQLRSQAEHIEQLLKAFKPNELDAPLVDAKLIIQEQPTMEFTPEDMPNTESPPNLSGEFDNINQDPTRTPEEPDAEQTEHYYKQQQSNSNNNNNNPNQGANPNLRDYELNDLVKFTCRPRVARTFIGSASASTSTSPSQTAGGTLPAASKSIKSIWSINNNDVLDSSGQVNAFDSVTNKFYFVKDQYDQSDQIKTSDYQPVLELKSFKQNNDDGYFDVANNNNNNTSDLNNFTNNSRKSLGPFGQAKQASEQQIGDGEGKSLLIEFTQSLFQAKELNLKCRTIVEQPLIEYEFQLTALVPTNQYIQVNSTSNNFILNNNSKNRSHSPSKYNSKLSNHQRNKNNQNSRTYLQQQESSSGSKSQKQIISYQSMLGAFVLSLLLLLLT